MGLRQFWARGRAKRGTALCLFACLLLLVGCGSKEKPLRIGLNAWPGYEFLYLAETQGFYKKRGVDVHLVEFGSLSDARVALERGQVDGLGTTVVEVLMARAHQPGAARIVRVVDYSDGADVLLARPTIAGVSDLKGKRVGVELGSLGVYLLASALAKHGLTLTDVVMVSKDQATMTGALAAGELDAIVSYPPESIRALREASAHAVFSSAEIPKEVVDVLAFQEQVLEARPKDVQRVLAAYDDALAFTDRHRSEACAIMAKREGIPAEEFDQALREGMRLVRAAEQPSYLADGGSLWGVAQRTEQVLKQTEQISVTGVAKGAIKHLGSEP